MLEVVEVPALDPDAGKEAEPVVTLVFIRRTAHHFEHRIIEILDGIMVDGIEDIGEFPGKYREPVRCFCPSSGDLDYFLQVGHISAEAELGGTRASPGITDGLNLGPWKSVPPVVIRSNFRATSLSS